MATNIVFTNCSTIAICPAATGIDPGETYATGGVRGVVESVQDLTGQPIAATTATTDIVTLRIAPSTIASLSVGAFSDVDGSPDTGSAVSFGDALYREATTGQVTKDSDDVLIGYALGTRSSTTGAYAIGTLISSGSTSTIEVILA